MLLLSDPDAREIQVDGITAFLTKQEARFLGALYERQGRALRHDELLAVIGAAEVNAARVWASRINNKVGAVPNLIEPIRGFGYRIAPEHIPGKRVCPSCGQERPQ